MRYLTVLLALGGFAPPHRLHSCGGPAVCYDNETGCQYSLVRFIQQRQPELSRADHQRLNNQARMRPRAGNHLRQLVDQVLAEQERAAAEGKRPQRLWQTAQASKVTPYLGDIFER